MEYGQIDPISAAAIALLSTLLGFLLSGIFQIIQDEKRRKWQKEDFLLQRRLEVINKRVNDAQIFIDNYLDLQNKIIDLELQFINMESPTSEMMNVSTQIFTLINEANKKISNILSFGDEDLSSIAYAMSVLFNSHYANMTMLVKKRRDNEEILIDPEISIINALKADSFKLIVKMGKRIDELSGLS